MIARYGVSFRCRYTSYIPASLVEAMPGVHPTQARPLFPANLSHAVILSTWNSFVPLDTSEKWCPESQSDQMKKVGLADWRTSPWSSVRICPGNGSRSDAKGIIVGVHDRQSVSHV